MQPANPDPCSGQQHGSTARVPPLDPVRYILVATCYEGGTVFKKIHIPNRARVSEVMRIVKRKIEPINVILAPLFEGQVAIGVSPLMPDYSSSSRKWDVFLTNCVFNQHLTYHLANASRLNNANPGSRDFADTYPQLLVSPGSRHVLVISSTLKDTTKFGILVLAVLATLVSGLAVGLATRNIASAFECMAAGMAVVGIFWTAMGKNMDKRSESAV